MQKNIGIVLAIIVSVGVGYFAVSGAGTEKPATESGAEAVQDEAATNQARTTDQTAAQTSEQATSQPPVASGSGLYESYSAEKIALAEDGKVVIFFHASWCPSCRALNGDIEANTSSIPAGVTILKTDYDKETELKKKYGVTTQHTLVQVDGAGNAINKWSGGSKLENLLSQLQ